MVADGLGCFDCKNLAPDRGGRVPYSRPTVRQSAGRRRWTRVQTVDRLVTKDSQDKGKLMIRETIKSYIGDQQSSDPPC